MGRYENYICVFIFNFKKRIKGLYDNFYFSKPFCQFAHDGTTLANRIHYEVLSLTFIQAGENIDSFNEGINK